MSKKEKSYLTGADSFKAYGEQEEQPAHDHVAQRGQAARTFVNHDTHISVKSDYNTGDYDYFRPSQTVPERMSEVISMCMAAYKKVGLVRNVIDLMGDFGAQGIKLQHPNSSVQEFYESWWDNIGGAERSERFLNNFYRCGQVIVKKSYGKVSNYQERKWKKGVAEDVKIEKIKVKENIVPLKYRFVNPVNVEVIGGDLAKFVGSPALGLQISRQLRSSVTAALQQKDRMTPVVKKMLAKVPKDVLTAIARGDKLLPLDPDKTSVYYYKKDDWDTWAYPMCYCILDDLLMLNQLKLADRSALDGAISNIRLWKLGIIGDSPATSILPTKTKINQLRSILANNVGGGTMDLVWGPELSFEESNSQVWRWLGSEKYATTITSIYEGLGIPASLRGGANGSTNTGSFIGLNTLIKRLQYGRDALIDFWNAELKYIHKAMGFAGSSPKIMFEFMAMADEAAERQLLINLWDREIISDDTILELFGRLPKVEKARVKRESKERTFERMPQKASPYHNPDKEHEYRKILLQGGGIAPSEIGIDLDDRKDGEPTRLEQMEQTQLKLKEADIVKQAGRPDNVTETTKRKSKPSDKPSTKAFVNVCLWANTAQENISKILTPSLLYAYGKKSVRSLSKKEVVQVEMVKFNVLCGIEVFSDITGQAVFDALITNNVSGEVRGIIKTLKAQFLLQYGRDPKIEEMRQINSSAYALYYEEDNYDD